MFIRGMQGMSFLTLRATIVLKPRLQGKMLRKLYESFPGVHDVIVSNALTRFRIDADNLPSWEDTDSAGSYRAPLCRDYGCSFRALVAGSYAAEEDREDGNEGGAGTVNVHEIEDVAMEEVDGNNHGEEDSMTPSSSSGYMRSLASDPTPELVRSQARVKDTELTSLPL